jgi:hypothetical protein
MRGENVIEADRTLTRRRSWRNFRPDYETDRVKTRDEQPVAGPDDVRSSARS